MSLVASCSSVGSRPSISWPGEYLVPRRSAFCTRHEHNSLSIPASTYTGFFHRKAPTGGLANGTPSHFLQVSVFSPSNGPFSVWTIGPAAAALLQFGMRPTTAHTYSRPTYPISRSDKTRCIGIVRRTCRLLSHHKIRIPNVPYIVIFAAAECQFRQLLTPKPTT